MENLSGPKPETKPTPCLLGLPAEIRQAIISEIVTSSRPAPRLSDFTTKNRHRLRNRFDVTYHDDSHIYVQRGRYHVLNAQALLATCRRLREDTDEVMRFYESQVENRHAKPLFKLDVMLVKDVGVFPTWLSFPYLPKHIDQLEIDFRIFRPSRRVPTEWLEAAQHDHMFSYYPLKRNLEIVFTMYALNQLSSYPRLPEEAIHRWHVDAGFSSGDGVDGYTSPAALYTVDRMLITTQPLEYWYDGRTIFPPVEDKWVSRSRHGGSPLSRALFDFSAVIPTDTGRAKPIQELAFAGQLVSSNLSDRLWGILDNMLSRLNNKYCHILARSVRAVELKSWNGDARVIDGAVSHIWGWVHTFKMAFGSELNNVAREIAAENSLQMPNSGRLEVFKTAARRMELGWWDHHR